MVSTHSDQKWDRLFYKLSYSEIYRDDTPMFKLPSFIFAAVMGLWMSITVTLAITVYRIGFSTGWHWSWFDAWLITYPLAVLCIMIYRPSAMKLTNYLVEKLSRRT